MQCSYSCICAGTILAIINSVKPDSQASPYTELVSGLALKQIAGADVDKKVRSQHGAVMRLVAPDPPPPTNNIPDRCSQKTLTSCAQVYQKILSQLRAADRPVTLSFERVQDTRVVTKTIELDAQGKLKNPPSPVRKTRRKSLSENFRKLTGKFDGSTDAEQATAPAKSAAAAPAPAESQPPPARQPSPAPAPAYNIDPAAGSKAYTSEKMLIQMVPWMQTAEEFVMREPGPLGIRWSATTDGTMVKMVYPDKQAGRLTGLQPGHVLASVQHAQGTMTHVASLSHREQLKFLASSKDRPLTVRVAMSPNAEKLLAEPVAVSFVFKKDGPLGLKLLDTGGSPVIEGIKPGTQAAVDFPTIQPGMQLISVNGQDVANLPYDIVLTLMRNPGRPLRLGFLTDPVVDSLPTTPSFGPVASRKSGIKFDPGAVKALAAQEEASLLSSTMPAAPGTPRAAVLGLHQAEESEVAAVDAIASVKRQEIEALYTEHNPEKLAEVDVLCAKYGVHRLLSMARKKYGIVSPKATSASAVSAKRQEIEALYTEHNPEKLVEVDALCAKYGEDRLLSMVRKKYGIASPRATRCPQTQAIVAPLPPALQPSVPAPPEEPNEPTEPPPPPPPASEMLRSTVPPRALEISLSREGTLGLRFGRLTVSPGVQRMVVEAITDGSQATSH